MRIKGRIAAVVFLFLLAPAAFAQNSITPGLPVLLPTVENISVTAKYVGDDNGNATVQLQFREVGTVAWKSAYPPYVDRRKTFGLTPNPRYKEVRGSIVGNIASATSPIKPLTSYEVRLVWNDPDGGSAGVSATTKTYSYTPPTGSGASSTVTSNAQLASKISSSKPGDVITLAGGPYSPLTISKGGNLSAFLKVQCTTGVRISAPLSTNAKAITIAADFVDVGENCTVDQSYGSGVALSGSGRQWVYLHHLIQKNVNTGCATGLSGGAFTVTANSHHIFIHHNESYSTALQQPACNPNKPANLNPGVVVSLPSNHGTIVYADNKSGDGFKDGFTAQNSGQKLENVDIVRNEFGGCDDDCVDTKGQNINVRVGMNKIRQNLGFSGIAGNTNSTPGANFFGPWYAYRNEIVILPGAASGGVAFKICGVPMYLLHNSIDNRHGVISSSGWQAFSCSGAVKDTATFRNNAVLSARVVFDGFLGASSADYDALLMQGLTSFAKWGGLNPTTLQGFKACPAPCQEKNGIAGTLTMFTDGPSGNFTPSPGSVVIDKGQLLPNFNTPDSAWPFIGAGVDIGAVEAK